MTTWFTSDTHFGHANVIKYCDRPFESLEEMDEAMIENWNEFVDYDDVVYHLGDFSLAKDAQQIPNYVRRLNGKKHLILGNHDQKRGQFLKGFDSVQDYKLIKVGDQRIALFHYAMKTWHGSHRGAWQLHGHSHGSLPRDFTMKQLDVGVDVWKFHPVSFEELEEEMRRHDFVPVDHHR